jgi:MFS transporter, putative metabolite:H+ symporter
MNATGAARMTAGAISARIDRLPATRTIWTYLVLLGFGMFFELYDLLFTAYVAPSLVKSGVLAARTAGLFGTTGVASFIAALFTGLFVGTILCGFLADVYGRRAISAFASPIGSPPAWWTGARPIRSPTALPTSSAFGC